MIIEGKKNLEFMKRALNSRLVNCSGHALRSSDRETSEKWDPEIAQTNAMLDAVERNLEQFQEEIPFSPFKVVSVETIGLFR
jgi:hypothetical protein